MHYFYYIFSQLTCTKMWCLWKKFRREFPRNATETKNTPLYIEIV